jgi:hypothetical protein
MNYQNIYESLITKRQTTPATGYTERHHILPKSLSGSDDLSNLVVLTGREHWVAHLLLYKIHRNRQMLHACNMMAMRCEERGIAYIKSSRLYEAIRIEHSKRIGQWTSKKGKANSQYGTMWICNIELEENKKISKNDIIPEGWVKGRNKWKPKYKRKEYPIKQCVKCNKDFRGSGMTCSQSCRSKRPMSEETKKKLSKILSDKPRPYRVGLKYNKKNLREVA